MMKRLLSLISGLLASGVVMGAPVVVGDHAYEVVNVSPRIFWPDAKQAAEQRTFWGVSGHLVTILSAEEMDIVMGLNRTASCWIGATDEAVEGEWRWVTGELFWLGGPNGSVQNGLYANWLQGEPNDLNNEDYADMGVSGGWNDLGLRGGHERGCYIVEYDLASLPRDASNVPTLGAWALLGLSGMMGLLGWRAKTRKKMP